MTRIEIVTEYQVNARGAIKSPGKFEGEMIYAPYFYDLVLGGWGEDKFDFGRYESDGVWNEGDLLYTEIDVEQTDRDYFPEIPAETKKVRISESDDGFISLEEV